VDIYIDGISLPYAGDVDTLQQIMTNFKTENFNNINNINIDCGESAFLARTMPLIVPLFSDKQFTITGHSTLLHRNIAKDFDFFRQYGWIIDTKNDNLPAIFSNAKITAGTFFFENPNSSQLISGLIMALANLEERSSIIVKNPVSINYIYLTINILQQIPELKIEHSFANNILTINIKNNFSNNKEDYINDKRKITMTVEGDWSSVSLPLVAATISTHNTMIIRGLQHNSLQADKEILNLFDAIKVNYFWTGNILTVRQSVYNGFEFDASHCPDLVPAVIVLAAFAKSGASKIFGINRLKNKESSRAEVLQEELKKVGIKIELFDNYMIINTIENINCDKIFFSSHNDHRIAMTEIIISALLNVEVEIDNIMCIKKSYPNHHVLFE
jgi:3-phosphoshikimate 1-carboxyvinyltransferase